MHRPAKTGYIFTRESCFLIDLVGVHAQPILTTLRANLRLVLQDTSPHLIVAEQGTWTGLLPSASPLPCRAV
jgi:hypothetical protein